MSDMPLSTPMDVRLGLTKAEDVAHPLRWGIIGTGNISAQWVLSLRACAGARVVAVAAREADKAAAFADKYDIPRSYGSYAEMLASPEVDVVYIGTITRLHREHTLLAIEAGKHVLCEKPLAGNLEDAQAMYVAAEAKGVMLQDAMWTRFFPAVEHARALIESGAIGDPVLVQSDFFDPIYTIQMAPLAFGPDAKITDVKVAGGKASAAIVAFGEEKTAVLTFPPFMSELAEVSEIVGTRGRLTLERPGHCPTALSVRIPSAVPSQYRTGNSPAPVQRFEYPLPANVAIPHPFPNQHGFLYQAEAVHRCLANGLTNCPQYDRAESLAAMRILTEINRARGD
ncbi:MAG: Gfo/Idh/MocA family oxidoreductase [Proteobacteria bacterium]|jgi:dihydrodiol dehydrogenase / D-xylose 1-dehydrogenase (NADP)|nr:Gfo/Idh/MocA family oxidoreductase [Pseudomonadota bacterium]MDA1300054.1 Gfo/Idh/MocA family oxidoreductase [Pseudomonadota bacterium]